MLKRMQYALFASLVLVGTCAAAETPAAEPPLSFTPGDPRLQWGPCPPFMPEGCAIAVLHGDAAKHNADIFFRVPAKASIPPHWHSSPERIVVVAGEVHIGYEGAEKIVLKPGSYAYGPAHRTHTGYCAGETPCVMFVAFELPVDATPVARIVK